MELKQVKLNVWKTDGKRKWQQVGDPEECKETASPTLTFTVSGTMCPWSFNRIESCFAKNLNDWRILHLWLVDVEVVPASPPLTFGLLGGLPLSWQGLGCPGPDIKTVCWSDPDLEVPSCLWSLTWLDGGLPQPWHSHLPLEVATVARGLPWPWHSKLTRGSESTWGQVGPEWGLPVLDIRPLD